VVLRRPGRRLHRDEGQDLEQVVLHHVAQGSDGVVEAAAVLDAEVLGHRDLDVVDVLAVPDRLEDRVGEAQIEDVHHRLLAEEVVDPQELGLIEVGVKLVVELARRFEVVAEWLFDHYERTVGETGAMQAADDRSEQRGRSLEVKDGPFAAAHDMSDLLVGLVVVELAVDVLETLFEAGDDLVLGLGDRRLDGFAGVVVEVHLLPLIARDPDDLAAQVAASLEAIEGLEGHLLRQVAGDSEDHQRVGNARV
jgi:hypothetical protein